jgi:hypothetical protein
VRRTVSESARTLKFEDDEFEDDEFEDDEFDE